MGLIETLTSRIQLKLSSGSANPIKYQGDSLYSLSKETAQVKTSPCVAMRWLRDNSDYWFETFVRLSYSSGFQGISIFNKSDDSLHRKITVQMGGGEDSSPPNQIYINNWAILEETLDVIGQGLDFDELETRIENRVSNGRTNPIGYGGGDLSGLSIAQADVMRSPCRALRWMSDNTDYEYETFVTLSDIMGRQGLDVFNKSDGSLVTSIVVPMGGGPNADPNSRIYINNTKIIVETLRVIEEGV